VIRWIEADDELRAGGPVLQRQRLADDLVAESRDQQEPPLSSVRARYEAGLVAHDLERLIPAGRRRHLP
jgi:hypothetical protein